MSDPQQIQHLHIHTRYGIEYLKDLLLNTEEVKYALLNPEHQIWLCVHTSSATELSHKIFVLKGAVVIQLSNGVKAEYYHYKQRIRKEDAGSEVATITEGFRRTFETYYKQIKKELFAQKYAILAETLGEDRAKMLVNCPNQDILTNKAFNDNRSVTTLDEREQLRELGLEIVIMEYV